MKLIYYIIIRISLVLSVLLTGWAILFYFAVMDEVNDEVDDSYWRIIRKLSSYVHWRERSFLLKIQLPTISISCVK